MNKLTHCLVIGLFITLALSKAAGQIPKQPVNVQSPNVAGLGQYGEVPVSLFTGLPQIEIPIYSITEGGLTVPISLSYHASGVRPEQHPGWVGLNWSLNVGGVISRTVKDIPDDAAEVTNQNACFNPNGTTGKMGVGFFYTQCLVGDNGWSTVWNSTDRVQDLARNYSNFDTEPDEFDFNFGGYSGKFFMDQTGNWRVQCDDRIKVELLKDPTDATKYKQSFPPFDPPKCIDPQIWYRKEFNYKYPPHFAGFVITTEDGTKYTFGSVENTDAVEYSIGFFTQDTDYWVANAWYLTNITDIAGRQINLKYSAINTYYQNDATLRYNARHLTNQMYLSLLMSKEKTTPNTSMNYFLFFASAGIIGSDAFLSQNGCESFQSSLASYGYFSGKLLAPVYLEEITGARTRIVLNTSQTTELRYRKKVYQQFVQWRTARTSASSKKDFMAFLFRGSYIPDKCPQVNAIPELENFIEDPAGYSANYNDVEEKLQWRKLDNIRIEDRISGEIITQFNFSYNNNPNQRLMLRTLQQQTNTSDAYIPPYQFLYDESASNPLPNYLTSHTDHWGFNNGKIISDADFNVYSQYSKFREPEIQNIAVLTAGTLNRIIYPTGGYTEFSYQWHSYGKELKANRSQPLTVLASDLKAGGLRISSITSYDPAFPAARLVKDYFYIGNYQPGADPALGRSSGILGGKSQYYWDGYSVKSDDGSQTSQQEIFSVQSVLPVSENSAGAHVGYSEVVERSSDGSITQYKFSNFDAQLLLGDNGHMDEGAVNLTVNNSPYEPYTDRSFERGKLLYKRIIDNTGKPLTQTSYLYYSPVATSSANAFVRAVKANRIRNCGSAEYFRLEGTAYKIYIYPYLVQSEVTTVYDQRNVNVNDYLTTANSYTHNQYAQLLSERSAQSDGRELITTYRYPEDVYPSTAASSSTDPSTVALRRMRNDLHMVGIVVEKQVKEKLTVESPEKLLQSSLTLFREFSPGKIFPAEGYEFRNASPIETPATTQVTGGPLEYDRYNPAQNDWQGYERVVSYNQYDNLGNIQSVQAESGITFSYLWGYNATLPIAEIRNASLQDVQNAMNQTPAISFADNSITDKDLQDRLVVLRQRLSGAMITGYSYSPLRGMTSQSDPSGKITYFNYDGLNRLKLVRDQFQKIVKSYFYHYKQ